MRSSTNVFHFADYRAFLLAHTQDLKAQYPRWSYGSWARKLGLKSTSAISRVLQGSRRPGPDLTERLVRYFRFGEKEAAYFRDLIQLDRVKDDSRLTVLMLEKMQKRHPHDASRVLDVDTFSVISHWYYLAIRELTNLPYFREDPAWIARQFRFKVSPREAAQAVETLLKLGLLRRDARGRLRVADGRVSTQPHVRSEAIKRYHEQMLDNAKAGLRQMDVTEFESHGTSLAVRRENVPKAKALIAEFHQKFQELIEESSGDSLYHLEINFFPLTYGTAMTTERQASDPADTECPR